TATISSEHVTFHLTNGPGVPTTLAFIQQPTSTTAGATISTVTVRLTDATNHPIGGQTITLVAQGPGTLVRTPPITATTDPATGVATFSSLQITTAGTYTLQASLSGVPSVTSNQFQITPGAALTIAVAGGDGQSTAVSTSFASPLSALV